MNLLNMKYAIAIAETKSLNKAAEKLYIGQPALSRSIKELESNLGTPLFKRSVKGMTLTPEGEKFIRYAKVILNKVDEIEEMFKTETVDRQTFSICVPRVSYICDAFVNFTKRLKNDGSIEIFYQETNAMRAVTNILNDDYKLGVVRFAESYAKYYDDMFRSKALENRLITRFKYVLIMSRHSPLAKLETISFDDLGDYTEIAHADPYVPSLPVSEVIKEELVENCKRRIFVFERGTQFQLLSENVNTFMWVSPVQKSLLDKFDLVQRYCVVNDREYNDVLIYRDDYRLSPLDNMFIEELVYSKRTNLDNCIIK